MKALHIDIGGTFTKIATIVNSKGVEYEIINRVPTYFENICEIVIELISHEIIDDCNLVILGIPGVCMDGGNSLSMWSIPHFSKYINIDKILLYLNAFDIEVVIENDAMAFLTIASSFRTTRYDIMLTFGTSLGLAILTSKLNKSYELAHCNLLVPLEDDCSALMNSLGIKLSQSSQLKYKDLYNGDILDLLFDNKNASYNQKQLNCYFKLLFVMIDNLLIAEGLASSLNLHICGSFFHNKEHEFAHSLQRYLQPADHINTFTLKSINIQNICGVQDKPCK